MSDRAENIADASKGIPPIHDTRQELIHFIKSIGDRSLIETGPDQWEKLDKICTQNLPRLLEAARA